MPGPMPEPTHVRPSEQISVPEHDHSPLALSHVQSSPNAPSPGVPPPVVGSPPGGCSLTQASSSSLPAVHGSASMHTSAASLSDPPHSASHTIGMSPSGTMHMVARIVQRDSQSACGTVPSLSLPPFVGSVPFV